MCLFLDLEHREQVIRQGASRLARRMELAAGGQAEDVLTVYMRNSRTGERKVLYFDITIFPNGNLRIVKRENNMK